MEDLSRYASNFKEFCWKHRTKIGIGALLVAGGAAYYYYYGKEESSSSTASTESSPRKSATPRGGESQHSSPPIDSERTRMLLAVHELYGFSLIYFLPNIRSRVRVLVDVSHAIQKLKELKNDMSEEARDIKVTLWDEINLSAFSALITTIYSLAGASTLLRVQMHILVRDASRLGEHDQPEEDIFYELMEGTYRHLFGPGMEALSARVKDVVGSRLREGDWNVESRMSVDFEEVDELMDLLRLSMEGCEGEGLGPLLEELLRSQTVYSSAQSNSPPDEGYCHSHGEKKVSEGEGGEGERERENVRETDGVLSRLQRQVK